MRDDFVFCRFLNKAAIITSEDEFNSDGSVKNPWRICTIQQVEEVKCLLKLIPVWISCIIYYISVVQQQNYVVFQALQSDRRLFGTSKFKIPAASYIVIAMLALTIWIPIFDRIIVPCLQKITGKEGGITILQRMGIGMVLSVLTMITSALVESKRRKFALNRPTLGFEPRKGAISSMSGVWLIPQLALSGLSEAFTIIGENELFYKECPENMRSIAMALVFVGFAGSSYLSSLLSSIVQKTTGGNESWLAEDLNRGRLDYFYYLIGALETLNLIYFLVCSKWYKYKQVEKIPQVAMEKLNNVEEKSLV